MQAGTFSPHRHKETAVAVGLACLLIFAPLLRGSVHPLPLMLLELGAVAVLLLRLWPPVFSGETKPPSLFLASVAERVVEDRANRSLTWAALALLFLYPLIYLIPLPFELWAELPGRAPYAQALGLLEAPDVRWRPLAIVPMLAESFWLALLPPLAVFLGAVALPIRSLNVLIAIVLGMAVTQALLGLMQMGAGSASPLCLGNPYCGGSATGTYVNRNHLAGLLEMVLPVGLGLLAATIGRASRDKHYWRSWRERLLFLSTWRAHVAVFYGAASIAILLGLIFTRSRSGVMLAMLGILLAAVAFARRLGGNNVFGTIGTVTAIGVALAVEIGLAPVLQRFTLADPLQDSRWTIYSSALQGIGSFFPLGSGAGTFPEIYRQFQPLELGRFSVDHVHNEYLEWLFEGGLMGAFILLLLLALYSRQWFRIRAHNTQWPTFRFAQIG
ncbi:MAG TPA: O-antigen ligase family protein, partial [Gammaproteobacteria bacterium]|nr:O-antigen ligase family protein [Gammaproteobacteria bacterium]